MVSPPPQAEAAQMTTVSSAGQTRRRANRSWQNKLLNAESPLLRDVSESQKDLSVISK